jgi:hypothetical protein
MRERATLFGGSLEAGPHGDGFRVLATLPTGDLGADPLAEGGVR